MNTNEKAQQLRLAADIMEHDLQWQYRVGVEWQDPISYDPVTALERGFTIRIKPADFSAPPAGEEWHNPANLTPEQVGVSEGWRLALKSEVKNDSPLCFKCSFWNYDRWVDGGFYFCDSYSKTYRTREPLPVWKLGRTINGFTLGEGQEWHRQDFTKEMLPEGYRPLLKNEAFSETDEAGGGVTFFRLNPNSSMLGSTSQDYPYSVEFYRTYRPLPPVIPEGFTPWDGGEAAPVQGEVEVIFRNKGRANRHADHLRWDHHNWSGDIIAYRSLSAPWSGPEDVPGPVCWMREKGYTDKHAGMVVYLFDHCMDIAGRGRVRYSDLHKFEHSTDRKEWKECVRYWQNDPHQ